MVVLIVGILSSVALPQYQVAVAKARLAAHMPLLRSLQKAQEQYYMDNGSYAASIRDLEVECQQYGAGLHQDWCYLDSKGKAVLIGEQQYFTLQDSRVKNVLLLFFFQPAAVAFCYAYDDSARRICKSLTGQEASGGWDNVTTHRLF